MQVRGACEYGRCGLGHFADVCSFRIGFGIGCGA
jgi:hypothetical protein